MQLKIQSPIPADVFYDTKSVGIAILDPVAMSSIQDDLKIVIRNPALIIEVNANHHLYFRPRSGMYQIAIVVMKEDHWYVENFIFDASLEIAQQKFKEGTIIYKYEK